MKATGIVRRIDDLGRVVIPKEIRRTLRIREGDPLEIFTDREGEVILKKYSPIGEIGTFAKQYAESLATVGNCSVIITDRDQVISVAGGSKKELMGRSVSRTLEEVMTEREIIDTSTNKKKGVSIVEGDGKEGANAQVIYPIISEGDVTGAVVIMPKEEGIVLTEVESKLGKVAAEFLGRQMEN